MENDRNMGERIRQRREALHLSQEELAERLQVSRQAVSKWESGRAMPTGQNLRALEQALSLSLAVEPAQDDRRIRRLCVGGWCAAAVLLLALAVTLCLPAPAPAEPELALQKVCFYDTHMEPIADIAGWYNMVEADCILLQWTAGMPVDAVRMLYTPAGTETLEETELLSVKVVPDASGVLLLDAAPLQREDLMGDLCFELILPGQERIVTDPYNVCYDPTLTQGE